MEENTFWTRTGYKVRIEAVSPILLLDLRQQYGVSNPRPFEYTYIVKETGAKLDFVYIPPEQRDPPESPPSEADDAYQFELYHRYLAHVRDFNRAFTEYKIARNNLVVVEAVKVLSKRGKGNWKSVYRRGTWVARLRNGGIQVTPDNRWRLFLKSEVLKREPDYSKAIDLATVEEVGIEDVAAALDRFQYLLAAAAAKHSDGLVAAGLFDELPDLLGDADGPGNEDTGEGVVSPAGKREGLVRSD